MKKALLFLLIILPVYLGLSLYYLDKAYFLSPVKYNGIKLLRSDPRGDGFFGAKRNGYRAHEGVDLFAKINTPVLASRSGIVTEAGKENGYGNYVLIRHPHNFTTIYAHLFKIYVRPNQLVCQGQVIGSVGKSGNANYSDIQPHLHFEIRLIGMAQDPLQYLD